MEDKFVILCCVSFICIFCALLGNHTGHRKYTDLKYNCEKQNNVFECELIAVPKGENK